MKRTNAVRRAAVKHTLSALVLAAGLLTQAGAGAAQTIELADVAAGTGGFAALGSTLVRDVGGAVSSAGDVNGDGMADLLLVSSDLVDGNPLSPHRGAYVVFGSTSSTAPTISSLEAGGDPRGFFIRTEPDQLLRPVSIDAAGDVNGDGLGDVVIGMTRMRFGGVARGGAVVVFGKTSTAPVAVSDVATGTNAQGLAIVGWRDGDEAGHSVSAAGDANGDGLADVFVAAPMDTNGPADSGRGYVVFGRSGGGAVQLSAIRAEAGSDGFAVYGQLGASTAGTLVGCSAGDVNGDGIGDLVLGARLFATGYGLREGRAYVLFGKSTASTVQLSALASGSSSAGFAINGVSGDHAGHAVSGAGDVNGDGLADVIVGATELTKISGQAAAGRAYVVFGKPTTQAIELSSLLDGSSAAGFAIEGNANGGRAGNSVSGVGDMNGDGLADVLVGAPLLLGGRRRSALVFGRSSTTPVAFSEMVAFPPSPNGLILNGAASTEYAGWSVAGAGDIDGDGRPDLMVGAPNANLANGAAYLIRNPTPPITPTSTYRAQVAAGDPDRQAIGVHRYGDDETVYPDSRLWIDFDGGAGPGLAASSEVVATITRSKAGLGADPAQIADVHWTLSTNRTGYTAARVTVRYTNAEIAGLVEGHLRLLTAPTIAGPFTVATDATINTARNEAAGTVASLPAVFALGDVTGPVPTITRLLGDPTANQNPTWSVVFGEPVGAQFTTGDIAPAGSLAGAVSIESITGASPTFTVKLVTDGENLDGTLGFDIVGGAVADAFGTASMPASAPAYTIAEVGAGVVAGDIDRDGQATVADVTALADHIVNGTPLP